MAPQNTAKSLMKEFRASFRRKKTTDTTPKVDKAKELEEEELAKLVELKDNLGENLPPNYTDVSLLGFLRARSLNVQEAEKLLKLDVNIRKILQIEKIEISEVNRKFKISGSIGFDKEGSSIRVINAGYADFKGYMHSVSTIETFKLVLWIIERDIKIQEEENKKTGRNNQQMTFILNCEGMSMSQLTYKPVFDTAFVALKLLQDHYHDIIKVVYIVNAPSFFSSVYKLFKPVIQDSLQQKVMILENENWKETLLQNIDADVLPAFLGGNRVDNNNDPNCGAILGYGGNIPESYYASNFLDPEEANLVVATVPAGSSVNFRFPVRVAGTVARWHIQAKDNDIGVGLYSEPLTTGIETPRTQHRKRREEDMSKFEQLTPILRSQCHICPEVGSTILWKAGNIIVHFDNTYSWMNSKEVYFRVTLEPPTEKDNNYMNATRQAVKALKKMSMKN